jgi:hypothetical protein
MHHSQKNAFFITILNLGNVWADNHLPSLFSMHHSPKRIAFFTTILNLSTVWADNHLPSLFSMHHSPKKNCISYNHYKSQHRLGK